jgi:hypothetical protein
MLKAIVLLNRISVVKMILINLWMLLILMAPSKFAEKLVTIGYERGAMLAVRRDPWKRNANFSSRLIKGRIAHEIPK